MQRTTAMARCLALRILPALLLISGTWAGVDLYDTCKAAGGAWNCDEYDYPYGAQAKKCTSGGTTYTCGVTILTEKRTICQAILDGMPEENRGKTFLDALNPICGCLVSMKADDADDHDPDYTPILVEGRVGPDIKYNTVYAFEFIDICISGTLIFAEGDDRDDIIANQVHEDGYHSVQAADVTIDLYTEYVRVTQGCWTSDGCDESAIGTFFYNYVKSSSDILTGGLVQLFQGWNTLFKSINTKAVTLSKTSSSVQSHRATASTYVDKKKQSICANNACTGSTQKAFLQQVSDALTAAKALSGYTDKANSAASAQTIISATINQMITETTTVLPTDTLVGYVRDQFITYVGDFIYAFPISRTLYDHETELKNLIVPIILATKYQSYVTSATTKLNTVLATDWSKKTSLPKTVRDGFTSIQANMKSELQTVLKTLGSQMIDLDTTLSQFPLRAHHFEFGVSASTYSRYTANDLWLPCLQTKTKTYTIEGYTASKSYPTFTSCLYGPEVIYLPSQFIPWMKWRFA